MSAPSPLLLKLALRLLSSLKIPVDRRRIRERGFVLPVAILIVLVLSLVTVGLLTRSTQRNIQTQVERAGQTVSRQLNAAIDRARAKIDYLIRDPRLPASNPTDAQLVEALINDGAGELIPRDENDPYILPDETQFVITTNIEVEDPNNPGQTLPVPVRAPAWWFLVDTDNNGVNDSVTAYTILNTRRATGTDTKPLSKGVHVAAPLRVRSYRRTVVAGFGAKAVVSPIDIVYIGRADLVGTSLKTTGLDPPRAARVLGVEGRSRPSRCILGIGSPGANATEKVELQRIQRHIFWLYLVLHRVKILVVQPSQHLWRFVLLARVNIENQSIAHLLAGVANGSCHQLPEGRNLRVICRHVEAGFLRADQESPEQVVGGIAEKEAAAGVDGAVPVVAGSEEKL